MIYVKDKLKAAGYKVWMDVDNMSKYCRASFWALWLWTF